MKIISLAFVFILFVTASFAQTVHTVTKSALTFEIKNLGVRTGGNLGGLKAHIKFDPANPGAAKIEASIDATTINTDNSLRDEHLRGENYFNTAVYPLITMTSTAVKRKSSNTFIGQFDLTIKGKTKQVAFPFTYITTGNSETLKGSFKINRRDFGIGGNSMTLSDEVMIFIDVEATKQ